MKHNILILISLLLVSSIASAWESWTFIVTADSRSESHDINLGVNVPILTELTQEVLSKTPDLFLFAGDLVMGNTTQELLEEELMQSRQVMQPVYEAGIPVYVVRGNHDGGNSSTTTAWNNVFKDETASGGLDYSLPQNGPSGEENLTYSVAHKNAFFLALDECTTVNHSKNYVVQSWIDTELASNTRQHVFSFGHYTVFKMLWDSMGDHPTERNAFLQSLRDAGSHAYFCGHEHFYHHAQPTTTEIRTAQLIRWLLAAPAPRFIIGTGTIQAKTVDMNSPISSILHDSGIFLLPLRDMM